MSRMKHRGPAAAALVCALALAARGDDAPLATSAAASFDLDTNGGSTFSVTSLPARALTYRAGDTISATGPNGATSWVMQSAAATAGTVVWTPTAGGAWTLVNSGAGTADFWVRKSLVEGPQGAGTSADPVRIEDDAELVDLVSGGSLESGTVFSMIRSATLDGLCLPEDCAIANLGGGLFCVDASVGGLLYADAAATLRLDTEEEGPDRKAVKGRSVPIAYSGDDWKGGDAASTLTLTSPSGVATSFSALSGSGAETFGFNEAGVWTVALVPASGTALSGTVEVMKPATIFSFR